jgi:hypothetical protein
MESWKSRLTTKLNNDGIFVGKGTDRFTNLVTKEITKGEKSAEVTLGRNARTQKVEVIDYRFTKGEPEPILQFMMSEPTPSSHPNTQAHGQPHPEKLGDPHE